MNSPKKTEKPIKQLQEALREAADIDDLIETLASGLVKLLDISGAVIFLVDAEKEHLHGKLSSPADLFPLREKIRVALDDMSSAAVLSITNKEPIVIDDGINDPRGKKWLVRLYKVKSYMVIPMLAGDEPIGSISLIEQRRLRHFVDEEVEVALTVANEAAAAISVLRGRNE